MSISIAVKDVKGGDAHFNVEEYPDICPLCRQAGQPTFVVGQYQEYRSHNERKFLLELVFRCPINHCRGLYIAGYESGDILGDWRAWLRSVRSNLFVRELEKEAVLENTSPRFYKIYSQCRQADVNGLDEVAGPGYRKALEILVKDYLINSKYKGDPKAKAIPGKFLGACISDDISDKALQQVAERTVWIGNDETHYERVHTKEDLKTLRELLELTLHHIVKELRSAELVVRINKPNSKSALQNP